MMSMASRSLMTSDYVQRNAHTHTEMNRHNSFSTCSERESLRTTDTGFYRPDTQQKRLIV